MAKAEAKTETRGKTAENIEALSFEAAMKELEAIVSKLESGQGQLEEAITLYERGTALRQHCETKLREAQMKIEKITIANGKTKTSKFDEE
jgi:exodeoxyribonuclease VII small subunit